MTTSLIQSIDSCRFMQDELTNTVNNKKADEKPDNKASMIHRKIYDSLIEKFYNTYQLCNNDHNKFALLLRIGIYPCTYMDSWKRFKEESLTDKEQFYSELNRW